MTEIPRSPEPIDSKSIRSRYYLPAMNAVNKEYPRDRFPGVENLMDTFFSSVDNEGVGNYSFYEPTEFQGMRVPYTTVNLESIARKMLAEQGITAPEVKQTDEEQKHERIAIYPAWAKHPTGHPFDLWGEVYHQASERLNQTIESIKSGKRPADVQITTLGLPHGFSGQVTKEWLDAITENGFPEYGKMYANLLRESGFVSPDETERSNTKYLFEGVSQGGILADVTVSALPELAPESKKGHVSEVLYIPTGFDRNSGLAAKARRIRMGLGLAADVARVFTQGEQRLEWAQDPKFREGITQVLKEKGIDTSVTSEQLELKKACAATDSILMAEGIGLVPSDTRKNVIRGSRDGVNAKISDVGRDVKRGVLGLIGLQKNKGPVVNETGQTIGHAPTIGSELQVKTIDLEPTQEGRSIKEYTIHGMHHGINYRDERIQRWVSRVARSFNM